jgi:polyisoprenoid-binding protein YceI
MKIKIIVAFFIAFSTLALNAQTLNVDIQKSTLKWHGEKVTGEHFGNINLKSGSLAIKDNQIASGSFVIDMTSITCTDLTDPGYNAKLVNHLKSDDFFGVAKHPEAMIEIMKTTPFVNNEATIEGKLTIKNLTHPVIFKAKKEGNAYIAMITVDRSKFDVRYGSGSFFDNLGDNMIYDEFEISVRIETSSEKDDVS